MWEVEESIAVGRFFSVPINTQIMLLSELLYIA